MNWDDLRIYLAITRAGAFAGAARALGVNQSTVSRRVRALERRLGVRLFERGAAGAVPTAAGRDLLEMARNVEAEIDRIGRSVAGRDARLSGPLRVTSVDMMVDRYLAPHFARFAALHPGVALSVVTPLGPVDLGRREAEVAIRVTADPPEALVGRRLCDFAMAVYGAEDFVRALPRDPEPAGFDWIGWESESRNRMVVASAYPAARVTHRADSLLVLSALVRAGMGASVLPCYWADREPGLRRIYPEPVAGSGLGLWVLTHPDMRGAARVRAFTGFITRALLAEKPRFEGRPDG